MVKRVSIKKDYSRLQGNFVAKDMDPVLARWAANPDSPSEELMREAFEVMLALLQKGVQLMTELKVSRLQLLEINKVVERVATLTTPQQLHEDAKWVSTLLKTM